MRRALITTAIAASLASIASPAIAEERTEIVRTGDLDIRTTEGMEVLQDRIKRAVRRVCDVERRRYLSPYFQVLKCRKQSNANAQEQVRDLLGGKVELLAARAKRSPKD